MKKENKTKEQQQQQQNRFVLNQNAMERLPLSNCF